MPTGTTGTDLPQAMEIIVLTLTPDNPCSTTITSSSGDELYSVVTDHSRKATFTTVRNVEDEVIGSLEWREVLPDRVTVGSNRPISMGDWIKKSKVPFKDHASFVDSQGRKYKWRGLAPGSSPELCAEEDNYVSAIARFTRSRRVYFGHSVHPKQGSGIDATASVLSLSPTLTDTQSLSPTLIESDPYSRSLSPFALLGGITPERRFTPATLSLLPRAVEIRDLVVLSLLFLEKTHRSRDRSGFSSERATHVHMAPMSAC